jgi:hypothetical protein
MASDGSLETLIRVSDSETDLPVGNILRKLRMSTFHEFTLQYIYECDTKLHITQLFRQTLDGQTSRANLREWKTSYAPMPCP